MISETNWFTDYQKLSDDEKEICKEYILDADKKAIILDYERLVRAIGLVASNPSDLLTQYNEKLGIAEEVALTFENECIYIVEYLKGKECLSQQIYSLIMQIDEQLTLLSNEHNQKNWTIEAMKADIRWISARTIANRVCSLLDGTKTKETDK